MVYNTTTQLECTGIVFAIYLEIRRKKKRGTTAKIKSKLYLHRKSIFQQIKTGRRSNGI